MASPREFDIKYLKGIGPVKAKLLDEELGIKSLYDLVHHFPTHYVDRSRIYTIRSFGGEMPYIQVRGRFVSFTTHGEGAKRRLSGLFTDGTATMEVVWFQRIKALQEAYHTGSEYILFGKPREFNGRWSMTHPEVDQPESATASQGLRGVYPLTEKLRNRGVTSRLLFQWISNAMAVVKRFDETLPAEILAERRLIDADTALRTIHTP
ncbi:MAG: ATP-dependent DNA helicase RecG, partial [Muribaculaceae bacterium]|nr:ATP-dependent DNA helicase RecG [Muribaculaceae bacterium]